MITNERKFKPMKVEIKQVGIKSAFKTILYLMSIPMMLMMLAGGIITLIGALIHQTEMLIIGIMYLIFPIFLIGIYGALGMLVTLIYNTAANKFGGLELTLAKKED